MKEDYVEGIVESPKVNEEGMPEQLRGAFLQATNTLQQRPFHIRDAMANGVQVPLGKHFERIVPLDNSSRKAKYQIRIFHYIFNVFYAHRVYCHL